MSFERNNDLEDRARAFIDEIMKINREYGLGDNISDEIYETAVRGSARVAAPLVARNQLPRGATAS